MKAFSNFLVISLFHGSSISSSSSSFRDVLSFTVHLVWFGFKEKTNLYIYLYMSIKWLKDYFLRRNLPRIHSLYLLLFAGRTIRQIPAQKERTTWVSWLGANKMLKSPMQMLNISNMWRHWRKNSKKHV